MELEFFIFILVGFTAQMIDGALGMAYGISSNSLLLSLGVPAPAASASVHLAEIVTTGISGFWHWKLDNVSQKIFRYLLIPGVCGGMAGAYLLSSFDSPLIKPLVSGYLLFMGALIVKKALYPKKDQLSSEPGRFKIGFLGGLGGFCDAIGGGGWGPVVTSTLIADGHKPRKAIGSVNLAEFFVTLAESAVFLLTISFTDYWQIIAGLIIGGAIAAPLAARVTKKLPVKKLMVMVGLLIILLSCRSIYLFFA